MEKIYWAGYCNYDRNTAINKLQAAISNHGDIIDFKFFSDISLTITIEIIESKISNLYDELKNLTSMDLYENENSTSEKERTIFLNITFLKGTGNLTIETPCVPG